MKLGDLVRSTWDIKEGNEGPLGLVVEIQDWRRGKNTYTTVRVLLFKSRKVESFNINQLEVMDEYQNK